MVDRVSFDGEVFAGGRQATKMEQFLACPSDVVVSKIRARQGLALYHPLTATSALPSITVFLSRTPTWSM